MPHTGSALHQYYKPFLGIFNSHREMEAEKTSKINIESLFQDSQIKKQIEKFIIICYSIARYVTAKIDTIDNRTHFA